MSVALELWRVLEAWDAEKHPRGPGGRFVHLGGGGHRRSSLADAVKGTAEAGPKRQRRDKGGQSVADVVRAAARRSDTTGRPTQRTVDEHRAHGAHDVADEVDRALADAGAPEHVRAAVSGRARARAETHGPRPETLPRAAASQPAARASHEEIQGDIHDAVRSELAGRPNAEWVGLADVRDRLGDRHSRADVDKALVGMLDTEGVRIIPIANTKALKPRDRAAALNIGGEDNHAISIRGDVPRPGAKASAPDDPKMAKLSDEQLQRGLVMHGTDSPQGRKVVAEMQRRGLSVADPKSGRTVSGSAAGAADNGRNAWDNLLAMPSKDLKGKGGRSREETPEESAARIARSGHDNVTDPKTGRTISGPAAGLADNGKQALAAVMAASGQRDAEVNRRNVDAAKQAIRDAVGNRVAPGGYVKISDVRNDLGERHNRHDVDHALGELGNEPDVDLLAEANQKTLTHHDRDGAVWNGGEHRHLIAIRPHSTDPLAAGIDAHYRGYDDAALHRAARSEGVAADGKDREQLIRDLTRARVDEERRIQARNAEYQQTLSSGGIVRGPDVSTSRPAERTDVTGAWKSGGGAGRRKTFTDADASSLARSLAAAQSRSDAHEHLAGLTAPQLRQLAGHLGVTVGSKYTKARLADAIVQGAVGRRLDSAAIGRLT